MCISLHLLGLNFRSHLLDQSVRLFRSFWRMLLSDSVLISLHSLVSSANILRLLTIQSGRSLTKSKNRRGPNTEPCGTPLSTCISSEKLPRTPTFNVLAVRNCSIQLSNLSCIPRFFNFSINFLCDTLSKAFL